MPVMSTPRRSSGEHSALQTAPLRPYEQAYPSIYEGISAKSAGLYSHGNSILPQSSRAYSLSVSSILLSSLSPFVRYHHVPTTDIPETIQRLSSEWPNWVEPRDERRCKDNIKVTLVFL